MTTVPSFAHPLQTRGSLAPFLEQQDTNLFYSPGSLSDIR